MTTVPLSSPQRKATVTNLTHLPPSSEQITELRTYLAANFDVARVDGDHRKAEIFRGFLHTLDSLVHTANGRPPHKAPSRG